MVRLIHLSGQPEQLPETLLTRFAIEQSRLPSISELLAKRNAYSFQTSRSIAASSKAVHLPQYRQLVSDEHGLELGTMELLFERPLAEYYYRELFRSVEFEFGRRRNTLVCVRALDQA
jgi:hypothetical protein